MRLRGSSLKEFGKVAGSLVLLAIPPSSMAEISKCVDKATGEITFTDQACADNMPGAHQRIGSMNIDTDSATPNTSGNQSGHGQKQQLHPERYQNRALEVGKQPPTQKVTNTGKPPRDTE